MLRVPFPEPAMYKILVVALFTACMLNVICLCGHLGSVAGPMTGSATAAPMWIASSLGSE
jgi:hypothetical protein